MCYFFLWNTLYNTVKLTKCVGRVQWTSQLTVQIWLIKRGEFHFSPSHEAETTAVYKVKIISTSSTKLRWLCPYRGVFTTTSPFIINNGVIAGLFVSSLFISLWTASIQDCVVVSCIRLQIHSSNNVIVWATVIVWQLRLQFCLQFIVFLFRYLITKANKQNSA